MTRMGLKREPAFCLSVALACYALPLLPMEEGWQEELVGEEHGLTRGVPDIAAQSPEPDASQ